MEATPDGPQLCDSNSFWQNVPNQKKRDNKLGLTFNLEGFELCGTLLQDCRGKLEQPADVKRFRLFTSFFLKRDLAWSMLGLLSRFRKGLFAELRAMLWYPRASPAFRKEPQIIISPMWYIHYNTYTTSQVRCCNSYVARSFSK